MPELFELTFFQKKKAANNSKTLFTKYLHINEGYNFSDNHPIPIFQGREILFDVFEEEDFYEYRLCIANIVFSQNVEQCIRQLCDPVQIIFDKVTAVEFATGIYELTIYYLGHIVRIDEINKQTLDHFPLIFLRKPTTLLYEPYLEMEHMTVVYHKKAQNLISAKNRS